MPETADFVSVTERNHVKILATLPEMSGYMPGAIIQVTGSELSRIIGGKGYPDRQVIERVWAGQTVEIDRRFDHAQDVCNQADEANKLPHILRTLADTLEMAHPAIDKVVAETECEVTE